MPQIASVWTSLDNRRRAIVALATVAVFAAVLTLARMASAPSMTLLYAGLETGAAGEVVRALEQRGTSYEIRGGSIFVDSGHRDELRMTLASEGLPANGGRGYELLDGLNGFGTTSQMFDAAYWRAKEGELARTIVASPHINQARVHIANASSSPFARTAKPTASVAITSVGTPLTAGQATAVQYLVASAVSGLSLDDVTVVDTDGTVLGSSADRTGAQPSADRSQQLKERVERLVEARVGPGNAVVEVSVETVTETESIRERRVDPDSRVAISTDTEERNDSSTEQSDGVTVASNLPDGDAAGGDGSSAQTTETRERVNYEVSETEREVVRAAGAIKRVSVAVLVNGVVETNDAGDPIYRDRSEAEIAVLRELVASAVGFDEARGDTITIHSMELPSIAPAGTTVESSFWTGIAVDVMSLVQMAVLAIVSLVLALFVIRPLLLKPAGAPDTSFASLPTVAPEAPEMAAPLMADITDGGGGTDLPALAASDWPTADAAQSDPVDRLKGLISTRQDETVEILRTWLEDKEETV